MANTMLPNVDVIALQTSLRLSPEQFAARYHLPLQFVQGWGTGRRQQNAASRALLTLISKDPEGIADMLRRTC